MATKGFVRPGRALRASRHLFLCRKRPAYLTSTSKRMPGRVTPKRAPRGTSRSGDDGDDRDADAGAKFPLGVADATVDDVVRRLGVSLDGMGIRFRAHEGIRRVDARSANHALRDAGVCDCGTRRTSGDRASATYGMRDRNSPFCRNT